jgi:hypothetical protein
MLPMIEPVMPAKAGIQVVAFLGSRFRGNDESICFAKPLPT